MQRCVSLYPAAWLGDWATGEAPMNTEGNVAAADSMVDRHMKLSAGPAGAPTPHNVTIDIYGEEFNFKASADEARRLIKAFERVNASLPRLGPST